MIVEEKGRKVVTFKLFTSLRVVKKKNEIMQGVSLIFQNSRKHVLPCDFKVHSILVILEELFQALDVPLIRGLYNQGLCFLSGFCIYQNQAFQLELFLLQLQQLRLLCLMVGELSYNSLLLL